MDQEAELCFSNSKREAEDRSGHGGNCGRGSPRAHSPLQAPLLLLGPQEA